MAILVILPTANERENLRPLVEQLLAMAGHSHVLVVDDGSPDGIGRLTVETAGEYGYTLLKKGDGPDLSELLERMKTRSELVDAPESELTTPASDDIGKRMAGTEEPGRASEPVPSDEAPSGLKQWTPVRVPPPAEPEAGSDLTARRVRVDVQPTVGPFDGSAAETRESALLEEAYIQPSPIGAEEAESQDDDAVARDRRPSPTPVPVRQATKTSKLGGRLDHLRRQGFLALADDESAYATFSLWQKIGLLVLAGALVVSLLQRPLATLVLVTTGIVVAYLAIVVFRFYAVQRGTNPEHDVSTSCRTAAPSPDDDRLLPVYTILCPLYHEAEIVEQFLEGVRRLDYPFDKLDIRLLLEEDDLETQAAASVAKERAGNLDNVQIVIVPDGAPKTKPKACNYGLQGAHGEFVVIFDAEDIPEPDQLRKALAAFSRLPDETVCVQAKLNYFNREQNLLTRFFTAEYSMWFDLFLPGLFAVNSPIPLGGTSNHFRTERLRALGGWDPFNVAEDADLGIRIARYGCRTAIIDSTTWEEANSRVGNWIRQRSRWVKGYMQVWLVTMRRPFRLLRALGPWRFFCFQVTVGGTPFVLLVNPVYWCLSLVYALTAWGAIPRLFPTPVLVIALLTGLLGNLAFVYLAICGLLKRAYYGLVPLMFLSPLYWVLQSVAAWKGLYQLIVKPHFWEKTVHRLAVPAAAGVQP